MYRRRAVIVRRPTGKGDKVLLCSLRPTARAHGRTSQRRIDRHDEYRVVFLGRLL